MGTDIIRRDLPYVLNERTRGWENEKAVLQFIACNNLDVRRGGVLYSVVQVTPKDPISEPYRIVFVDVYEGAKGCPSTSVKGMDETMHPYYYDCPLELLALAGDPDARKIPGYTQAQNETVREWSNTWRKKVNQYWEERLVAH